MSEELEHKHDFKYPPFGKFYGTCACGHEETPEEYQAMQAKYEQHFNDIKAPNGRVFVSFNLENPANLLTRIEAPAISGQFTFEMTEAARKTLASLETITQKMNYVLISSMKKFAKALRGDKPHNRRKKKKLLKKMYAQPVIKPEVIHVPRRKK